MTRRPPEVVEVDARQLDDLLGRVEEGTLDGKDVELIRSIFQSYVYITGVVGDKNTTIRRLRQLIFGASSEKTQDVLGDGSAEAQSRHSPQEEAGSGDATRDGQSEETEAEPAKKGHGRNGADAYRGAEQIEVPHDSLKPGDPCPDCGQGKLYEVSPPGVLVRVVGQAPLQAKVYRLQKLRCHLCGKVFTAPPPEEAEGRKYDATAASMIAVLKYGSGLPFNRLERLQRNLEIPLPASTQWDILAAFATSAGLAYDELISQAAQGDVLYNDDTTVKILERMGKRAKKRALDEVDDELAARSGLFTSGVVSTREGRRVALFFSGRKHSGENLAGVLRRRSEALEQPIQMCDALSRNLPSKLQTIVANCLAHGRRRFVEVVDRFPDECRYVLESLKIVYRNDADARKRSLSPAERLVFHQANSQQVMTDLQEWLKRQIDEKLVEPNSALGEAIHYMLNHWQKLTLFLRVPGAPLDNNICERALKKAILHRKTALFFKTENGARVGDLYMSLIYTCELNQASPFDYLTELHRSADQVAVAPDRWMPWNYRATLDAKAAGCPASVS